MDYPGLSSLGCEDGGISELCRLNHDPFTALQPSPESYSIALANHSMELIFRVCCTWPQMLAEGFQLPPIFHTAHFGQENILPQPLATCTTLVKMWHGQRIGAEEIVRKTIVSELNHILDQVNLDTHLSTRTSDWSPKLAQRTWRSDAFSILTSCRDLSYYSSLSIKSPPKLCCWWRNRVAQNSMFRLLRPWAYVCTGPEGTFASKHWRRVEHKIHTLAFEMEWSDLPSSQDWRYPARYYFE